MEKLTERKASCWIKTKSGKDYTNYTQDWETIDQLAEYEVAGLTPEQVQELSDAISRMKEIFGNAITIPEVIQSFLDFCEAQADESRVEDVVLLTNEEAGKWKKLKERDTAKEPVKEADTGIRYTDSYRCPNCKRGFTGTGIADFCYHCGQRLKWEDN